MIYFHNYLYNMKFYILTIVGILIYVLLKIFNLDKYNSDETIYFYLFYIFISCPIQEFLYRGVFGYFDKLITNKYMFLILPSLMYSFVHIIYKDYLTCILTLSLGIIN